MGGSGGTAAAALGAMAARGWAESRVPVLIVRRRPTPRAFECERPCASVIAARHVRAPSLSGRVTIPVAHGQLEGILREASSAVAAAVVCHPHPRGGGTMNNNVVYRAAKALVGRRRHRAALQLPRRRRVDRQLRRRRRRGGGRARRRRLPARARAGAADLDRRVLVRRARRPDGRGAQRRRRRSCSGIGLALRHVRLRVPRELRQAQGDRPGGAGRVRRARGDRSGGARDERARSDSGSSRAPRTCSPASSTRSSTPPRKPSPISDSQLTRAVGRWTQPS